MKLYLVRHGETEWNKEGRMQGKQGVGLNETGVLQLEKLRDEIRERGLRFDICFASPLKRAVETAEILVGGECEILYDERLV
ncbi:histidine phosphatase family protein, partial [Candidatus Saccharibacteria bacterium]|nr:histidine phosphatase family protein [Candidatus Saccharibacteria bacterium]